MGGVDCVCVAAGWSVSDFSRRKDAAIEGGNMKHRADLDGVRGFACLSVLVLHIVIGPIQAPADSIFSAVRFALQPFMVGGVDLFFVLSGFLIGGILLDNKEAPASNFFPTFWRRRIGRIFPVYYLMIGVLLAFYAADALHSTAYTRSLLFNQMPIWSYATFTQNFYMVASGIYGNFLGVTWSLAMEEQFYLLLPFAVFFFSRGTIAKIAVALILLAPVVRTIVWELHSWRASYHLSPARMDTVMWGVLIAYAVRRTDIIAYLSKRTLWIDGFIVTAIVLITSNAFYHASAAPIANPSTHVLGLFISTLRYSLLAAMYALIILRLYLPGANAMKAFFSTPWLGKVGVVSYAAYMYHQLINMSVHFFLGEGPTPKLSGWGQAYLPVLVFALTFAAAAISYRFMEKPIQDWSRRAKYDATAKPPASATITVPDAIPMSGQPSR